MSKLQNSKLLDGGHPCLLHKPCWTLECYAGNKVLACDLAAGGHPWDDLKLLV